MDNTGDEPVIFEGWAERQVRQAIERGEFDHLPGVGKPVYLGEPGRERPWIVDRMAREDLSGVLPAPLALRRQKEQLPQLLANIGREDDVRELVEDLNQRIKESNLNPAQPRIITALVDVEATVAGWRARRVGAG